MNGSMTEHLKKQQKGENAMGRHDKKTVKFSWEPMPDDFYKARINTLEKENARLHEKVAELEAVITEMEHAADLDKKDNNGLILEYGETIEEQGMLIADLKEAIVRAALREVEE